MDSAAKLSRRGFLRASGALVAMAGLAACAPAVPGASSGTISPATETVALRKMAWGSPLEKANIESGLDLFMEQNPGITVEYIHTPDRYAEVLQTMLAAGNAPDVYKVGNYYPDIAVKGALLDVTDLVKSDAVLGDPDYFFPFEEQRCLVDGKWYAIGSTFQWRLLYYSKAAFDAAGIAPPDSDPAGTWTWDHFLEVARALTVDSAGNHPGDSTFNVQNVEQWGFFAPDTHYNNYIFSNGGVVIDDNTLQFALDQPEAYEAVQRFADLRLQDQVAAQGAVLESVGMNAWQMLATEKVAIIQDGNWALQDISQMDFEFGVGIIPMLTQPASVVASSWTGIYADTAYPEESWRLLHYLNLDDYQAHLVRVGLWGVSHQTLLTEEGVQKWWDPSVHPDNWLAFETDYKLNYGQVIPNVVGMLPAEQRLTQALSEVWTGARTAEDVLVELTPILNDILLEEQSRI